MPENLENSAVVTGLKKVSFHSNPKERECQRRLKLPHNWTHFTPSQSNAQNSQRQASTVNEPVNLQMLKLDLDFCFIDYAKARGSQQTLQNSERDGNTTPPDLPLE